MRGLACVVLAACGGTAAVPDAAVRVADGPLAADAVAAPDANVDARVDAAPDAPPPPPASDQPDVGIYAQFDRRGWPSEYWSGQVIARFDEFDDVVDRTVGEEVGLQLDAMRALGAKIITFELRAADPDGSPFTPPACTLQPVLGLQYPQPTATELANLPRFLDLAQARGIKVWLRLVDTHMEEPLPKTRSRTWLTAILGAVGQHPALDLVLFEGNTRLIDSDGDGVRESCGVPAEPPLYLGPRSEPGRHVAWAIGLGMELGIAPERLSAEAIVGAYFVEQQPPAGPDAEDRHLWSPVAVLKAIFDELAIPEERRTYAISLYEHRKCADAGQLACVDATPHAWADETLAYVRSVAGERAARIVAPEMGVLPSAEVAGWNTRDALESLGVLLKKHHVAGGAVWQWVAKDNAEEMDGNVGEAVKRRGPGLVYTPLADVVVDLAGTHPTAVPDGSFEDSPTRWTTSGAGTASRVESDDPLRPWRGTHFLRIAGAQVTSEPFDVWPEVPTTLTAHLRVAAGQQAFVEIVHASSTQRFDVTQATTGFAAFPVRFTPPAGALRARVRIGAVGTVEIDHVH